MFFTNFKPDNLPNSGLFIPTNTNHNDLVKSIVDLIVDAPGSEWAEVDGVNNPSFLNPFASQISDNRNSYTISSDTSLNTDQATLYLATDPGLQAATPHCRLLRFRISVEGIVPMILDTRTASGSNGNDWAFCHDVSADRNSIINDQRSNTNYDHRLYLWMHDGALFIRTHRIDTNQYHGGLALLYPEPPFNQTVSRKETPFIFSCNFVDSDINDLNMPADPYEDAGNKAFLTSEIGTFFRYKDYQNRDIFYRVGIGADSRFYYHIAPFECMRVSTKDAPVLSRFIVGNKEFVYFRGYDGRCFYIANEDVSA